MTDKEMRDREVIAEFEIVAGLADAALDSARAPDCERRAMGGCVQLLARARIIAGGRGRDSSDADYAARSVHPARPGRGRVADRPCHCPRDRGFVADDALCLCAKKDRPTVFSFGPKPVGRPQGYWPLPFYMNRGSCNRFSQPIHDPMTVKPPQGLEPWTPALRKLCSTN